jgi:hypothetical protein
MTDFARPARLAALTAAGVALLALAPAAATAAPEHNPKGHFLGVVKAGARGHAPQRQPRASGGGDLTYHGGPVMHANRTHIVYWEPSGHQTTGAYKTLVQRYMADVQASSGSFDNVYGIDAQYTDSSGRANHASTFAGAITDANDYPASGCTHPTLPAGSVCLTDAQVRGELDSVITDNGLPRGLGDVYFVLTPAGVGSCSGSGGQCSYSYYCAYHSAFLSSGQQTLYAVQPWADVAGCDVGQSPNGDTAADNMVNLISHEHNEAITDPLGDAWYDLNGAENGDKCVWDFGATQGTSPNEFNQSLNSNHYMLQQEWSNATGACALVGDAPPTASFTVSPAGAQPGSAVAFDGSGSSDADGPIASYAWSFGDGQTATGSNATHAYAAPGIYAARLTVTDSGGVTDATTRTVSVTVAPPPTTSNPGPPPATPPAPVATRAARPSVRLLSGVNRVTRARVALVRLSCGAGADCRGSVTISGRVRAASGAFRSVLLGMTRFSLRAGHTAWVRVPLTSRVEGLLRGRRRVSVTLRASASGAPSVFRSATLTR